MYLLLAVTEYTDLFETPHIAVALVLIGLSTIISIGSGAATIWHRLRPHPSASEELRQFAVRATETFATKVAVSDIHGQLRRELDAIATSLQRETAMQRSEYRSIRDMVSQGFTDLHRAIGRVEGKMEDRNEQ